MPEFQTNLEIPDDLSGVDDLDRLEADAHAAYNKLRGDGASDPDTLDTLSGLADSVTRIRAEREGRIEREQRLADLDASVTEPEPQTVEPDPQATEPDPQATEPDPQVIEPDPQAQIVEPDPQAQVSEPVAAGIEPAAPVVTDVSGFFSAPAVQTFGSMVVQAAVDVPGHSQGTDLSLGQLGEAAISRFGGMRGSREGQSAQQLATLRRPFTDSKLIAHDNDSLLTAARYASDESRLSASVETAGWCAPSETLYELCDLSSVDGLISLPEVLVNRGGLQWFKGSSFCEVYNSGPLGMWTEADDDAAATDPDVRKACLDIPCPTPQEVRLTAIYLCIRAGLMQARGFPELIQDQVSKSMTAYAHYLSAIKIASMEVGSEPVTISATSNDTTAALLSSVELAITDIRDAHRMPFSATLEVVLPHWARGMIRADIARRQGTVSLAISNATINEWFAARDARVQWVYDWQPLGSGGLVSPGDESPGEDCPPDPATTWPSEIKFLVYPSGTWVVGTADVINLQTMYDSTLLEQNRYQLVFREEGLAVMDMCFGSRVYTVPVCPSGETTAAAAATCPSA
ncbi:MAG: major capsid protein [Nocardioidaceae bacterium]